MAQSSSEECHGLECDVCREHGHDKIATSYCEICDELLCQACENAHRGMKLSRNHGLILASKLDKSLRRSKTPQIVFCDEHNADKVEFFCKDHSVVCCQSCKVSTHRTCKIMSLQNKAKDVMHEKQFETAMQTLMSLKSKIEKLNTTRKEHAETSKALGEQLLEELKEFKREIDDYINKLVEQLVMEIGNAVKSSTDEIQGHLGTTSVVLEGVNSGLDVLCSCRETKEEVIMTIGCVKLARKIKEYENTLASVEDEVNAPNFQLHLMDIERMKAQIQSLGSIAYGKDADFLDLKVSNSFELNVESNMISGSVFMPSGELVLCDRKNSKLLLYTQDFKQKFNFKCSTQPWDIAVLDETDVVVTHPDEKKLIVYKLKETIQIKKEIIVNEECWGVDVKNSNIYISTHKDNTNRGVQVLDKTGKLQRKIGHNILSQHSVQEPYYVCVNAKEDKIYLSCYKSSNIVLINMFGELIFQYKGDLHGSLGMCVDDKNNVIVSGRDSNIVCVLRSDGSLHKKLLSETDGIKEPYTLSYRASDGALVVGMRNAALSCKVFMMT